MAKQQKLLSWHAIKRNFSAIKNFEPKRHEWPPEEYR
jgi:hypothetical protein